MGLWPSRALPLHRAVRLAAPSTLMLFSTSRAPALRTRRSRCPATPGPCSLWRSVPRQTGVRHGRCSHGLSAVRNSLHGLGRNRLPGFRPSCLEKPDSTSPSPSGHSGVSSPADLPVPKNRMAGFRLRRTECLEPDSEEPDPVPPGHPPGPVLGFSRQQ